MKKWILRIVYLFLLIFLLLAVFSYIQLKDRFPGYGVDLTIEAGQDAPLKAGFAALTINPALSDSWTDANGDGQFNLKDGDTFEDKNGNGKFDAIWMAGFQNRRPAQGQHDDLWARAMVLDDGTTRLAWVVVDAIGYGGDEVIQVRKLIPNDLGVDYIIISSTHTHEAPDLVGLWGESHFKNGVNKEYRTWVQKRTAAAVVKAAKILRPAKIRFAQDLEGAKDLVMDARKPIVLDAGLRLMQVIDLESDTTLGTLIAWANHPETLGNKNLLISSDFPNYVRDGVENGIYDGDSLVTPGLGGVAIYANGSIGGLMTTSPEFGISALFKDTLYTAPSFDKIEAQGHRLAQLALEALEDPTLEEFSKSSISLRAKTFDIPMDNKLYRLAAVLHVLNRGLSAWMKIRTEVCLWQLGPAQFLHHPAEIYPEIVNGGIEAPQGQDFSLAPQEVPPLRKLMSARYKFVMGLSNDLIGYAIPKSEWDEKEPFLYDLEESPYGEINSLGPQTAPILYRELVTLLREPGNKQDR